MIKRSEIIARLRQLQAESANARGWLDALDKGAAELLEALAVPAEAQPAPAAQPEPEPDRFTVQPADGRDAPDLSVQFEGDPVAPSLATLVTPKQLGMIRALAREAGVDYELECQEQLGCKAEEMGKRAASAFIDYLKLLSERGAEFRKVG
jgi:hypothetical protein